MAIVVKFDDSDVEIIETLIRVFSTFMGIKENVVYLDKEQWIEMLEGDLTKKQREKISHEMDYVYGQCNTDNRVIFLNPRMCKRQWAVLVSTIIHELLHIRFPDEEEETIRDMERAFSGRYDTVYKADLCKGGKNGKRK